jgi:predicted nucleic acid-binding protein
VARFLAAGQTRTQADISIAATAIVHGIGLVTRDTGHFEGCGVSVFNPFS